MMEYLTLPMHRASGDIVQLTDILGRIPNNKWVWSVLEFNGVGIAPGDIDMDEFERLVSATPGGQHFSWSDLQAFAKKLEQTYDCLIIAVGNEEDINLFLDEGGNAERCQFVIEAHDSTSWNVAARSKDILHKLLDN